MKLSDLHSPLLSALRCTSSAASTIKLGDWLSQAVKDLAMMLDEHPQLWESFGPMQEKHVTQVRDDHTIELPSDALRIGGRNKIGDVNERPIGRVATTGSGSSEVTSSSCPTVGHPELLMEDGSCYVLPKLFARKTGQDAATVRLFYLKAPASTTEFSASFGRCITFKAGIEGARELHDPETEELCRTQLKESLAELGVTI